MTRARCAGVPPLTAAALALSVAACSPDLHFRDYATPLDLPEDTWVTFSGEVEAKRNSGVSLATSGGSVVVDTSALPARRDGRALSVGDEIVVSGRLGTGRGDVHEIEAKSITLLSKSGSAES